MAELQKDWVCTGLSKIWKDKLCKVEVGLQQPVKLGV